MLRLHLHRSGILKICVGVWMCIFCCAVNAARIRRVRSLGALKACELYEEGFRHPRAELCAQGGSEYHALLLISSSPEQYATRILQRARLSRISPNLHLAFSFFLGAPHDGSIQPTIDVEADLWQDIIQGNSVDSYRNSTLKTFSIFEWILDYCPLVPLLIKADNDAHINTTKLLELLPTMMKEKRTIWGKVIANGKPQRNRLREEFVPQWVYPYDSFPTYVKSNTFVMTTDIVYEMLLAGLRARLLPLPTALLPGLIEAARTAQPVLLLNDPIAGLLLFAWLGATSAATILRSHSSLCPNKGRSLQFMVLSVTEPQDKTIRYTMRAWWGRLTLRNNIGFGFVLGMTPNQSLQKALQLEDKHFSDIIVADFIDTPANRTLKTLTAFDWMIQVCPYAPRLLKLDGLVLVNLKRIWTLLQEKSRRGIWTRVLQGVPSVPGFPHSVYPRHAAGGSYLISMSAVYDLVKASRSPLYLPLEDVWFTGILASFLNIELINEPDLFVYPPSRSQVIANIAKYGLKRF